MFRFNEDCHFSNCNYREHQTHFHCMRKDCNYRFCDKTRFVQHTARHERLDTLCGDEFQGFRGVPCGREECELNVLHNTSRLIPGGYHFSFFSRVSTNQHDFMQSWVEDTLSRPPFSLMLFSGTSFSRQYFWNYGVESEFKCVISIYARKGFRDTTDVYIWIRRWSFLLPPQSASSQHSKWKLFTLYSTHLLHLNMGKMKLVKHEIVESTSRADLDFDVVAACSKCFISSFLGKAILLIIYTHFWAALSHNLHKLEKSSNSHRNSHRSIERKSLIFSRPNMRITIKFNSFVQHKFYCYS